MSTNIAYLDYSIDVECPRCDFHFDIVDTDAENQVGRWVFNNQWGMLEGYEVECPNCGLEFNLDGLEY